MRGSWFESYISSPAAKPFCPLPLFLLSLITGCLGTGATPIVLESAQVMGDPSQVNFELSIEGRGFGLTSLQYNLNEGTGASQPAQLTIALLSATGRLHVIPRSDITLNSPQKMMVRIKLGQPLGPGLYGLELMLADQAVSKLDPAFEVKGPQQADMGVGDLSLPPRDLGMPEDTGTSTQTPPLDGGLPDAEPAETGPVDMGMPNDWIGAHRFRQRITVAYNQTITAGTTLRIPIPHDQLVSAGRSRADAKDLIIYHGTQPLSFQWEDRFAVGTSNLAMIVSLSRDLLPGVNLVLYYGDLQANNATTDGIFAMSERFEIPVSPVMQGDAMSWFQADNWLHCNLNRPEQRFLDSSTEPRGAYCGIDRTSGNLVRQTLSTPKQQGLQPLGPGLAYEMSIWMAGRMIDGDADILYFAMGADNSNFDRTQQLPDTAFSGFVPNADLRFREIDDRNRTVRGWRFPQNQIQWWQQVKARFNVSEAAPSLHFRHVSTDSDNSTASFAAIDDWWIRLSLDPEPAATLAPVEVR